MNTADFYRATEQFPQEYASAATFAEFAASLDASKPGIGRLLQHIAAKYPESWEAYFATIKTHGRFLSRSLVMPHARKVTDIWESVGLFPMTGGCARRDVPHVAAGHAFVSGTRAPGFAYFGYLGAKYGFSANGTRAILRTGNGNWLTAAKPNESLRKAHIAAGPGEYETATYEAIRQNDGRILICSRDNLGIGSGDWIALLDAGQTALSMLSEHELGEIAAEQAAQAAAWPESHA